jgi:predicted RNA-binding Zn-ribbon protein involved in translation (DUF1610 family)
VLAALAVLGTRYSVKTLLHPRPDTGYRIPDTGYRILEGVELEIVETPLVVHCDACGKDRESEDATLLRCPLCGGGATVVSGDETAVTAVRYDEA